MTTSNEKSVPTFFLVGHCVPDSGMLTNAITRAVPDARVIRANDDDDLDRARLPGSVWLVNRVLDGNFENDDGLALIGRERRSGAPGAPAVVLISNRADAQAAAVALGARPGFGKRATFAPETATLLAALG